jgi:hydroxyacylglutathione hydrolase
VQHMRNCAAAPAAPARVPAVRELADGVWQLDGFPKNGVNIYVLGDVLVDAGVRLDRGRILKQVAGRGISAHALTHAHPDHYGASRAVTEQLGIPLWCGAHDAEAVEAGKMVWLGGRMIPGPPSVPVARRLREGDEVAGFTVLHTPGHSAGHVAYWRESDRVLVAGDVLNGMNLLTSLPGLHEPPSFFTPDPARNRESIRRIAALEPALVLFGHGPPLRDPEKLARFSTSLPSV